MKQKYENKWLQAAEDARLKLNVHRRKIRRLQKAIRLFEKFAKTGEPWPGESSRTFGQEP